MLSSALWNWYHSSMNDVAALESGPREADSESTVSRSRPASAVRRMTPTISTDLDRLIEPVSLSRVAGYEPT